MNWQKRLLVCILLHHQLAMERMKKKKNQGNNKENKVIGYIPMVSCKLSFCYKNHIFHSCFFSPQKMQKLQIFNIVDWKVRFWGAKTEKKEKLTQFNGDSSLFFFINQLISTINNVVCTLWRKSQKITASIIPKVRTTSSNTHVKKIINFVIAQHIQSI